MKTSEAISSSLPASEDIGLASDVVVLASGATFLSASGKKGIIDRDYSIYAINFHLLVYHFETDFCST